jgi:hypothetical protein
MGTQLSSGPETPPSSVVLNELNNIKYTNPLPNIVNLPNDAGQDISFITPAERLRILYNSPWIQT